MRTSLCFAFALFVAAGPAHAADDPLLVVPAGAGDSLEVTASIAREATLLLRNKRSGAVKLAYPLDRPSYAPSRRVRLAKKYLRAAKRNYRVLELDSVRKNAHKALKLYKEEIKRGAKPDGYVEALHYLGAAETVDGNENAGFKWLNDAYLFSKRSPDSKISNPQVQAMHAKVVSSDDHVGSIEFEVQPGALLWLNNTLYGAARGKVELRAGLYLLRIGHPGFLTYEKWMRVRRNKTRRVVVRLQEGGPGEPATIARLRKELDGLPATSTLLLATDYGAAEVLVIGATASCTRARCPAKLRWAKGGKWIESRDVTSGEGPQAIAKLLMGVVDKTDDPGLVPGGRRTIPLNDALQCRDDAQCLSDQRCRSGRCEKVVPVTRKWWFWTIIGVVVAGAGATTAVLLTRPENPVLEVR